MRVSLRFALALVMAPLLSLCSCGTNSDNFTTIVFADIAEAVKDGGLDSLIEHDHRSVRDAIISQIDSGGSDTSIESVIAEYENLTHIHDLGYRYRFFDQLTDETRIARDSLLERKLSSAESSATYTIYSDSLFIIATRFAEIGDTISLALTLFDLAEALFYDSLKLEKAKRYLDSAIELMIAVDDPPSLGYFYFQASYWYRTRLANYRVAETHAIRAVHQYERVGYTSAVVAAQEAVGVVQFQQQEYYRALKWFSLASGGPSSHYYLGHTYLGLNQVDSAAYHATKYLELVENAKESIESDMAIAHTLLGRVMAQQGERQGANSHFEIAEQLLKSSGSQKERAINLIYYARLLNDERNVTEALRALSNITIDLSSDRQIQLFFDLEWARALYLSGMVDSAQAILWGNLTTSEKLLMDGTVSGSQLRFFQDKLEFYNILSFCYYSKYLETKRFEYLDSTIVVQELSRARTLTNRSKMNAEGHSDNFDKLIQARSSLQKRLFLEKDDSLLTAIAAVEDSLRYYTQPKFESEVRVDDARTATKGSPLARMMKTEDSATATLYYITGRDRTVVIVGRGNSIHAYDLEFSSHMIDSLANQLRREISSPPTSSAYEANYVELARKLGDKLVFSRLHDTVGLKTIRIVPSHHLAFLPFAALIDSHGNYLIENYALEYAPSLRKSDPTAQEGLHKSFLFVTSKAQELDSIFEGVAPRDLNLSQYYDITLPKELGVRFAGKEIEMISAELDVNTSVTQVGPTEEEFWSIKPDTFSTIFVASHSLVHTSQPERSALLLLPSETGAYDGLVQPIEIESHNWQSDLIFLSTCESGGGERVAGEGTLSLARSFIHGGAMNVIATMWPLDDRFSVNFSSRFFSEYRKDVSASQALRIAQQKTIRSSRALYKHPFYWASYHCIN